MRIENLECSTCAACGLICVPPEPIGCERCGAPAAQMTLSDVSSAGTVTARAVVHQHAEPEPETPFVAVEVMLDAGPVVRSLLRGENALAVKIGQRVAGGYENGRFAFDMNATSGGEV